LVSTVYNKVLFFHLNPASSLIHIYDLDPTFVYKTPNPIKIAPYQLTQMQIIDNLLVLHNLDERSTQIYDLKLGDYHDPILIDACEVKIEKAIKGIFMTDLLAKEESTNPDEKM
jgi:hypothetical protein